MQRAMAFRILLACGLVVVPALGATAQAQMATNQQRRPTYEQRLAKCMDPQRIRLDAAIDRLAWKHVPTYAENLAWCKANTPR